MRNQTGELVSNQHDRNYYDTGWNDYIDGKPLVWPATASYRDGWRDAQEASEAGEALRHA